MKRLNLFKAILTLSIATFVLSKPLHATVLYCEVLQSGMILENNLRRTAMDGKKFKIQIDQSKVIFSENAPLSGTFNITDTWRGAENGFIANNNKDTSINYDEGNLHIAQLMRIAGVAVILTGFCEKF